MILKNIYNKAINLTRKQEIIITVLMVIVGAFLFLLNSPVHPLVEQCTGVDSSVFKTVALMMEKGYMPYRDSFDHKGPLLYILNFFGNKISYYIGIWFIEFVFLAIAFYVIYKIARLFCNIWQSLLSFFVAMILMCNYFQGGNLVEEYAVTFIAISLYIFIDYFENKKITILRLVICGATFAGTLMLRPNMIAIWCVMCLAVLIKTIVEKAYRKLFKFIGWFVSGMAIVIIPIIIWLYCNGALQAFWEDYIVFNQQYSSSTGGATLINKFKSFIAFSCTPVYLIALMLQLFRCLKKRNLFTIAYFLMMIISPIFICVSGQVFAHYGMILVPVVVYPIAMIFQEFNSYSSDAHIKYILCAISLAVFVGIGFSAYKGFATTAIDNCVSKIKGTNINTQAQEICSSMDTYGIGEDEPISVYGNNDIYYVMSKRPHATTYSYQFPIGQVMTSIMDDYMDQLEKELPRAIVVGTGYYDDNIGEFLEEYSYKLVCCDDENFYQEESAKKINECPLLYIRQ